MDGLALGDEPDVAVHLRPPPGGRALDEDAPGRRREQAGHQVEERRLAGAVRAEQAGHAGTERERDVVDRDDVAVPARDVVDLERRARRARRRPAGGAARRRRGAAGVGGVVGSVMPRSAGSAGRSGPTDADDADRRRRDVRPARQVERRHDRAVGDRAEDRRVRAVEDVGRAEQDDRAGRGPGSPGCR